MNRDVIRRLAIEMQRLADELETLPVPRTSDEERMKEHAKGMRERAAEMLEAVDGESPLD